jgi:predicted DNA repair protein MutK
MAGTSLFALLDDIASMLDDVATMTKVATKKTAGVLGDDLALNAEQVTGVRADRELAVVWAVFKGSSINKVILVPAALVLSQFLPQAIKPLLMLGGAFLCFEGAEKVLHKLFHSKEEIEKETKELKAAVADPAIDLVAVEKEKIKGAVRTDFILSAEIIVISLGAMEGATFGTRVAALIAVASLMTIGVYGLVAGIVKLDDAGISLSKRGGGAASFGRFLLWGAPLLMKFLSIAGTIAMFLVGGGILVHGIAALHHVVEDLAKSAGGAGWVVSTLGEGLAGLVAGALLVAVITPLTKLFKKKPA